MNRSKRSTTVKKSSKLEELKQLLHPSNTIKELPCRHKEYSDIFNFTKSSLLEQVGGCMFISGVPGSGKTATVHRVIEKLFEDEQLKPLKNKIKSLEINGLKLSDPNQFYSHFYFKIFGKKLSKQKAIEELEEYFQNPDKKDPFIILLVDELDQLCTRKQNILYHIFDWPNRPNARLIILSIANTMDLPERMMMNKIKSRLGLRRLQFRSYTYKDLVEVVESRINESEIIDADAVQLISRKVAAISGDARRVLDLCRRSLDIAEKENLINNSIGSIHVTIKHAQEAISEVYSSDKAIAISNASEQEKIFLQSLIHDFKVNNSEEAYFEKIYESHKETCTFDKIPVPTMDEFIEIAYDLFSKRIILIEKNKIISKTRITLNVLPDEISYILNKKN